MDSYDQVSDSLLENCEHTYLEDNDYGEDGSHTEPFKISLVAEHDDGTVTAEIESELFDRGSDDGVVWSAHPETHTYYLVTESDVYRTANADDNLRIGC